MGITGCSSSQNESAFYVAVDGSDENNGSKNKPFATPARTVKAVRELVAAGLTKPVTVYFHNGEYNLENLNFTSEDSGTAEYPVTYKAYGGGDTVTLTPGNSVVENCYIHHCGEVYRTYHP